jgi:tetratricopeptide (TPR) repeat protein
VSVALSHQLYFGGDIDRIESLVEDAASIAEELDDPRLRSAAVQARTFGLSVDRIEELPELAARIRALAREAGDPQLESAGILYAMCAAIFRGDRATIDEALEADRKLAARSRLPMVRSMPLWHEATVAVLEGRLGDLMPLLSQAVELATQSTTTNSRQWGGMLLYVAGRHLGQLRVTEEAVGFVERFPDYPVYRAYLAAILAAVGERDEAKSHLDRIASDGFASVPRDYNRLTTLPLAADVACLLGDPEHATMLYDLLLPWQGRHAPGGAAVSCLGPIDLRLGMLSLLLGETDRAVGHLRSAVASTVELGARPFEVESRLALARALSADGPRRDATAARSELERVVEVAGPLGMATSVTDAERLLAEL